MRPEPCGDCGAALATDQRYCVECGKRVGAPLMLPYAPTTLTEEGIAAGAAAPAGGVLQKLPIPGQAAAMCAALALGFGAIVGTAISPNLARTLAGATVVVQEPPPDEPDPPPPPAPAGGGGGTAVAAAPVTSGPTFSEPVSSTPAPAGGGGGTTKQPKEKKEKPTYATGVVVHQNPVASSYTLDGPSVKAVHTGTALPVLGAQVKVPVRDLANGTVAEDGKRQVKGTSTAGSIAGIVTHASDSTDPAVRDRYTVSARGVSMMVHSPADPTGALKPPEIGSYVRASVNILDRVSELPTPPSPNQLPQPAPPAPTCDDAATTFPTPAIPFPKGLYETALTIEAKAAEVDSSEINGVVQAVCPGTGEILISADDVRETAADLYDPATGKVIAVAPGVSLTGFIPGQPVTANVSLALDGTGTLRSVGQVTGIRDDTGIAGAENDASAQGDLK